MSPSRRRLASALAAVAALLGPAGSVQAGQPRPEALDIDFGVTDLVLSAESLDSSVSDAESATQVQTTLAADVLFEFDRADLSPAAGAALAQVAESIKARAKGTVSIDGYTDSVGDDAYNLDLSRRRAATVHAALQPLLTGTPVTFQVAGHGEADPVAANANPDGSDNPAGRAKNRRVTVSFDKR